MFVQIDLRKEAVIKIMAAAPFPVITFGPFPTPEALMTSLSHAIGKLAHEHENEKGENLKGFIS